MQQSHSSRFNWRNRRTDGLISTFPCYFWKEKTWTGVELVKKNIRLLQFNKVFTAVPCKPLLDGRIEILSTKVKESVMPDLMYDHRKHASSLLDHNTKIWALILNVMEVMISILHPLICEPYQYELFFASIKCHITSVSGLRITQLSTWCVHSGAWLKNFRWLTES